MHGDGTGSLAPAAKRECDAATRIQAVQRGRIVRKATRRAAKPPPGQPTVDTTQAGGQRTSAHGGGIEGPGAADHPTSEQGNRSEPTADEQAAATRIQAIQRGRIARKAARKEEKANGAGNQSTGEQASTDQQHPPSNLASGEREDADGDESGVKSTHEEHRGGNANENSHPASRRQAEPPLVGDRRGQPPGNELASGEKEDGDPGDDGEESSHDENRGSSANEDSHPASRRAEHAEPASVSGGRDHPSGNDFASREREDVDSDDGVKSPHDEKHRGSIANENSHPASRRAERTGSPVASDEREQQPANDFASAAERDGADGEHRGKHDSPSDASDNEGGKDSLSEKSNEKGKHGSPSDKGHGKGRHDGSIEKSNEKSKHDSTRDESSGKNGSSEEGTRGSPRDGEGGGPTDGTTAPGPGKPGGGLERRFVAVRKPRSPRCARKPGTAPAAQRQPLQLAPILPADLAPSALSAWLTPSQAVAHLSCTHAPDLGLADPERAGAAGDPRRLKVGPLVFVLLPLASTQMAGLRRDESGERGASKPPVSVDRGESRPGAPSCGIDVSDEEAGGSPRGELPDSGGIASGTANDSAKGACGDLNSSNVNSTSNNSINSINSNRSNRNKNNDGSNSNNTNSSGINNSNRSNRNKNNDGSNSNNTNSSGINNSNRSNHNNNNDGASRSDDDNTGSGAENDSNKDGSGRGEKHRGPVETQPLGLYMKNTAAGKPAAGGGSGGGAARLQRGLQRVRAVSVREGGKLLVVACAGGATVRQCLPLGVTRRAVRPLRSMARCAAACLPGEGQGTPDLQPRNQANHTNHTNPATSPTLGPGHGNPVDIKPPDETGLRETAQTRNEVSGQTVNESTESVEQGRCDRVRFEIVEEVGGPAAERGLVRRLKVLQAHVPTRSELDDCGSFSEQQVLLHNKAWMLHQIKEIEDRLALARRREAERRDSILDHGRGSDAARASAVAKSLRRRQNQALQRVRGIREEQQVLVNSAFICVYDAQRVPGNSAFPCVANAY
ncbi:hypothetical protein DIPPA_00941 [Diplonema papillatum]|nr:hypothetical protein DIPPA_00941 [Diplonema papillatum]